MTTSVPYNSFYYQCADIILSGDAPPDDPPGDPEVDGGCSTSGGAGFGALVAVLALLARRRR